MYVILHACDLWPYQLTLQDFSSQQSPCNTQVLISKDKHVAGRVREHVEGLEAEVNVLRRLDHPNIVRYLVRPHPTP